MSLVQRLLFPLLAFLCLALPAWASAPSIANTEHAQLELLVDTKVNEDGIYWAAIEVTLEEGWHIYWQNPGDSGLEASINWTLPAGSQAGPIHWLAPKRIEYSGLFNYGYEEKSALLVPVKHSGAALTSPLSISAAIEFLICKDVCIPQQATLSNDRSAGAHAADAERILQWRAQIPKAFAGRAEYDINEGNVYFAFDLLQTEIDLARIYHAWWYPEQGQVISNASEQQWRLDGSVLILSVAREGSAAPAPFNGVLEVATTDGQRFHFAAAAEHKPAGGTMPTGIADVASAEPAQMAAPAAAPMGMLAAILSAFLGGIILNLMPCVLPVLSLKALSIARKAGSAPREIRRSALAYCAGIVLSFVLVAGILIMLQRGGAAVGWGFQLQSVGFVSALIYVLFLVGLSLSGAFTLPSSVAGIGQRFTQQDGAAGSFFTGVLATVVATPCTAPFMAAALGVALTQPPALAMLIFVALGLGLAFPLVLISYVPAATRLLPKPGAWMEHFKQALAFPIYATIIWLLWVLTQQAGSMGLLHALIGLLILAFTLWLLPLVRARFLQLLVIMFALAALVTITALSRAEIAAGQTQQSVSANHALGAPWSAAALEAALAKGDTVFVNATAAWCITCKVNERVALRDAAVQQRLQQEGVTYLVADWTNRDGAIRDYLARFGRSGVPMYVVYQPNREPVLLPQLLTPTLVLTALTGESL